MLDPPDPLGNVNLAVESDAGLAAALPCDLPFRGEAAPKQLNLCANARRGAFEQGAAGGQVAHSDRH
jgi:hypothetical protein